MGVQALDTILRGMTERAADGDDDDWEAAQRARQNQAHGHRDVIDRIGKRYHPSVVGLDKFRVYHERQRAVLDRLRAFAADMERAVAEGRGLVLYGTVGTGKDHLLASMLYAAIKAGHRCAWINGQDIFAKFRDAMDSGTSERELVAEFKAPTVLGISDPIPPVLDPNKPAAWRTELLYRVLDARYRECKATWVSLNAMSPDDADGKLSAPVFDRLRDNAELVACFWPSYREQAK